ncbi:homeobox protein CDX-1-like [Littorina saxatilis]|uniref:homeobox protein CDX-1-like n=1 Tax=Littorina saxatilis TaxID=31220 RepID=UPI0038B548EF
MALCENLPHPLSLSGPGGRPSPTFFNAYSSGFVPVSQSNVSNGHMVPYGLDHGQYQQFHTPLPTMTAYDSSSPPQAQQQHQQQPGEDSNSVVQTPQSWHYPMHLRATHAGLEDWSQHYLPAPHPQTNGGTPPLHHHHHSPYNYPYPYDPLNHGVETSPSTDSSSPSGGQSGGPGAGSGTKQLRPPFEWMKPANVQPAPGKTRTKDKYRVVYSDHQRLELEKEFHFSRYITIRRKGEIAEQLHLSERQVKIWFQNRRAKERKQNKKRDETLRGNANVPKLEPLESPPPITAQHHPHGHAHSPNMGMNINQHHHVMGQPGNGGLQQLPVSNHHNIMPSSLPQQRYHPQRLSPVSSQGMMLESHALPHTATPTSVLQLHDSCSHQTQSIATPTFEEKREPV